MKVLSREPDQIARRKLLWIFVAQGFSIAPLGLHLPWWIFLLWLGAMLYRLRINQGAWRFPSMGTKLLLGMACVAGLWFSYKNLTAVEPMIGFLICSFALKLVELRNSKDITIVLFIGFIAVAAQFLFAQGVFSALFALLSCIVLVTAWQAALTQREKPVLLHVKNGSTFILSSLPFMVVLFVVMPRIGPLWSVPVPQGAGKTGMSDELTLGDIGELAKSREPAFRATFDDATPAQESLYWRGILLEHFDGRTWRQRLLGARYDDYAMAADYPHEPVHRYSVIIEPHRQRWLFSLGVPLDASSDFLRVQSLSGHVLQSRWPVVKKSRYRVASVLSLPDGPAELSELERRVLTQLPDGVNPRTRLLGESWLQSGLSTQELVDRALNLYRHDFVYTLKPQRLGFNAIDEFLFDTRRGFCEHYASSFVFLMRAAGVPARIVTGYQGGEVNPIENYILVRQSDAHAWTEIWSPGAGWIRIDPTNAVAPNRVEHGVEEALAEDERSLFDSPWHQNAVLFRIYQRWDAMGFAWNRWVLNYDNELQKGLLARLLGEASPWRIGAAFLAVSALLFAGFIFIPRWYRHRSAVTKEIRWIRPLLQILRRRGQQPRRDESFSAFVRRAGQSYPAIQNRFQEVADVYEAVVYGEQSQDGPRLKQSLEQLIIALRRQR